MKNYFRSIALIPSEDRSAWYCLWSAADECYRFIAAETDAPSAFRKCIQHEVAERLGLSQRDLLVANMAQLHTEFVDVLPGGTEEEHVAVAFYMVHLYSKQARWLVDSLPSGSWLTGKELIAGVTKTGRQVDQRLSYLLAKTQVVAGWS